MDNFYKANARNFAMFLVGPLRYIDCGIDLFNLDPILEFSQGFSASLKAKIGCFD